MPAWFTLLAFVPKRVSFCQDVKCAPRESRIFRREDSRWQIRGSRALDPGQFASGKWLLLDKCMRGGNPVRKMKRGASATALSCFLFALSPIGVFLFQLEKYVGKSASESRLSDGIFLK